MKVTGESRCIDCQRRAYDGPVPEGLVPLSLIGCSLPSYQAAMCLRFMKLKFEAPTVSRDMYKSETDREVQTMQAPVCKACPSRNLCPARFEPRSYDCKGEGVDQECFSCDQINTCEVLSSQSDECPEHEDPNEEEDDE